MTEPSPDPLPSDLAVEVLDVLNGPGDHHAGIERLCREHPEHEAAIRDLVAEVRSPVQPADADGPRTEVTGSSFLKSLEDDGLMESTAPPLTGRTLANRYEITRELGSGGMAVVYLAHDSVLDRDVALKLVHANSIVPHVRERLLREAKVVARMDHPSIVPVYDMQEDDGLLFFVMPVVQGGNLRQWMTKQTLRLGDVLDIGIQVADALSYSHELDVLHRDIKPENIMVAERDGRLHVRITDFGLALQSFETRLTSDNAIAGTCAYLSPEQVGDRTLEPRSDVYALATVLHECMTGLRPFEGPVAELLHSIAHASAPSLSAHGVDSDRECEDLLLRCLQKNPRDRPTARELADALESIYDRLSDRQRGIDPRAVAAAAPRRLEPLSIPLVGRVRELSETRRRMELACGGECQFILFSGDVGVGKTRLVREIEKIARLRGIRTLTTRLVDQDPGLPLHGFADLIQDYFRVHYAPGTGPSFSDLAEPLLRCFPSLSEVDALNPSGEHAESVNPTLDLSGRERIDVFELIGRTLARMLGDQPMALLIEALHLADVSVEALQYVVRRLASLPCLIVGTTRPFENQSRPAIARMQELFASDEHFTHIRLANLAEDEHRMLLGRLLDDPDVSRDLAHELFEATDGNPFFTCEIIRSLVDSNTVRKDESGAWSLANEDALSASELPATVHQAVEHRVDGLPGPLRDILRTAAVLGRVMDYRDLAAIAGDTSDVDRAADRLIHLGLLEEVRDGRQDRLGFVSGVVRDVVYAALTRRTRRRLHREIAMHLERRFANRLDRVYLQLLHHFSGADEPTKVLEYGIVAGRAALASFSPKEAIHAARTVLDFLDDERSASDSSVEAEARCLLVDALRMRRDFGAALNEAERAAAVLQSAGDTERLAELMLLAAETAWAGRRIAAATDWVERGIRAANRAGSEECQRRLLTLGSTLANLRGEYDVGLAYAETARRLEETDTESADPSARPQSGGQLRVAMANPIQTLEPAEAGMLEDIEVLGIVYETLVTTDADGRLVPLLCKSWQTLDEGRSFVFRLRDGVVFHDGGLFGARDVKASFERAIRLRGADCAPAFASIQGAREFADSFATGHSSETRTRRIAKPRRGIDGITVLDPHRLRIDLTEPLPIYPALLTGHQSMIVRAVPRAGGIHCYGTGPFQLSEPNADAPPNPIVLRRNPRFRDAPALLDEIEFRVHESSAACAKALRTGVADLTNSLGPTDLDQLLRDPGLRAKLVERARNVTYFLLFNKTGPTAANIEIRRVLSEAVDVHQLVWRYLGRLAEPATSLIPPGTFGHDPGRRRRALTIQDARTRLTNAGVPDAISLRAAVNPVFLDTHRTLWDAVCEVWRQLGIEVHNVTDTPEAFRRTWTENEDIDLLAGRWVADYNDPDDFTYGLFHSRAGVLRTYFSSPSTDELTEQARLTVRPEARQGLYRKFEKQLTEQAVFVPLFHDTDYRVVHPGIGGVRLLPGSPFVSYTEVHRLPTDDTDAPAPARGTIHVPTTGSVSNLDPATARSPLRYECLSMVFETLMRVDEGANTVPWLAASMQAEDDNLRFRVRLRDGVRFHDGRRLTGSDVRASFERALLAGGTGAHLLAPIRGAAQIRDGSTRELAGFQLVSSSEFVLELAEPTHLLPFLLTHPATAIVPEIHRMDAAEDTLIADGQRWVGTGPFRVSGFSPGERLELTANRGYWRQGRPRSEKLSFYFGVPAARIPAEFRAGRFSLAAGLRPADAEALQRDSGLAADYREAPRMATALLLFNSKNGPLRDLALRRSLARMVDIEAIQRETLRGFAIPARDLTPPSLYRPGTSRHREFGPSHSADEQLVTDRARPLRLRAAVLPHASGHFETIARILADAWRGQNVRIDVAPTDMTGFYEALETGAADVVVGRWIAEYPDAHSFVHRLFDPGAGLLREFCGSSAIATVIGRMAHCGADPAALQSLYGEFERTVASEALLVPLFHEQMYRFARPEVSGLRLSLFHPTVAYDELFVRK